MALRIRGKLKLSCICSFFWICNAVTEAIMTSDARSLSNLDQSVTTPKWQGEPPTAWSSQNGPHNSLKAVPQSATSTSWSSPTAKAFNEIVRIASSQCKFLDTLMWHKQGLGPPKKGMGPNKMHQKENHCMTKKEKKLSPWYGDGAKIRRRR